MENDSTSDSVLTGVLAGMAAVVVGLFVAITCLFCCWRHKLKTRASHNTEENQPNTDLKSKDIENSTSVHETTIPQTETAFTLTYLKKERNVPDVLPGLIQEMSNNQLLVPENSITMQNMVGEGEFGIVYKALLHNWRGCYCDLVAVKTLKGVFSSSDVKRLAEESQMMAQFDHPNVMKLLGVSISKSKSLFLVMPFMANGSLLSYLRKNREVFTVENKQLKEVIKEVGSKLLSICLQVAKGMEYLAQNKFVHRDLSARNCMIDLNNVIKVADFGLTEDIYLRGVTQHKDGKSPVKLPVKWMALESLNDGIFSEKSDVWSFGVTCWEVFSLGKNPYPGVDPFSLIRYLERGERLDKPLNAACSQEIYGMMSECWEVEPWKRPHFSQLVTVISTSLEGMAGYLDLNSPSLSTDMK